MKWDLGAGQAGSGQAGRNDHRLVSKEEFEAAGNSTWIIPEAESWHGLMTLEAKLLKRNFEAKPLKRNSEATRNHLRRVIQRKRHP